MCIRDELLFSSNDSTIHHLLLSFLSVYKVTDDMFYFCPVTAYNTQDTRPDCYEICLLVQFRDYVNQETDTPITL